MNLPVLGGQAHVDPEADLCRIHCAVDGQEQWAQDEAGQALGLVVYLSPEEHLQDKSGLGEGAEQGDVQAGDTPAADWQAQHAPARCASQITMGPSDELQNCLLAIGTWLTKAACMVTHAACPDI